MSPDPASPKHDLLNRAARESTAFHEMIQGLNEAHLLEVWLGTWSIREIVAHMSGWHRELGHESFMHAAAAVPEERFQAGKTAYRIVDGNSAHHYEEHADQIRAWRASRRF